jgi:hypothetical protein
VSTAICFLFVVERKALAVERELVVAKSALQSGNELAAEDTAEDLDGQQECQGRGKTRPVVRSKSRPVDSLEGGDMRGVWDLESSGRRHTPRGAFAPESSDGWDGTGA